MRHSDLAFLLVPRQVTSYSTGGLLTYAGSSDPGGPAQALGAMRMSRCTWGIELQDRPSLSRTFSVSVAALAETKGPTLLLMPEAFMQS